MVQTLDQIAKTASTTDDQTAKARKGLRQFKAELPEPPKVAGWAQAYLKTAGRRGRP